VIYLGKIAQNTMKALKTISGLRKIKKGCVLTIGNFDGLHIGHQAILAAAKKAALQNKTKLVVMTFEPHPLALLFPQKSPDILTPLPLKRHLLARFGVDYLVIVRTTRRLLGLSPADFVRRFLFEHIRPGIVIEGESFNFGLNRAGDIHTLQSLAKNNGFHVISVEAKEIKLSTGKVTKVSSTLIRNLLAKGRVADAAIALDRPYRLIEKIIPGRGKGKQLGFPTANMRLPPQLVPADGVYAGFVEVANTFSKLLSANRRIPAAFSIGRPNLYGKKSPLLIEAHLLINNVGRLYNKLLAMDFIQRIRSQKKFKTDLALSAQIAKDCKRAKEILRGF
jgi:riboflavin kinase/FMN adenylyltransferase